MLHLNYANRLESLAACLATELAKPTERPLEPEWLVVPHTEMGRWLSLYCARANGICANIQSALPHTALWRLMRLLGAKVSAENRFTPDVLALRIYALLIAEEGADFPAAICTQVANGDLQGAFAFATRLANLFDQYLLFRPDWILAWEAGNGDHWQARLWRRLSQNHDGHWASCLAWAAALTQPPTAARLPTRIHCFLPPGLSQAWLAALFRMGDWTDVIVYQWMPSAEYWGDLSRLSARQSGVGTEENRLLATMGGELRDYLEVLQDHPAIIRDHYRPPDRMTDLARVQSAIFECRPTPAALSDHSIQIQACHGRRREVEVCRDRLLDLFARTPDLALHDVLVTAPRMSEYQAYIRATFGDSRLGPLPYRLLLGADHGPFATAVFRLLEALVAPLGQSAVLDLLALDAVRRSFGLLPNDLGSIRDWMEQAGLFHLEAGEVRPSKFSWHQAARRLLLGTMQGAEEGAAQGLSNVRVAGADVDVLAVFLTYLDRLSRYGQQARQPRAIAAWQTWLNDLLPIFLKTDSATEEALLTITGAIAQIRNQAEQAACHADMPLGLVAELLRTELARSTAAELPGTASGLTFASAAAVRLLPYRVVYVLGLNDGEFPANDVTLDMDLIAQQPRKGDRSRRSDDRLIFLEWLCCARSHLVLSYIGHNSRDDTDCNPSAVLTELSREFEPSGAVFTTHHPAQAFSPRYGRESGLFTYAPELRAPDTIPCGNERFIAKPLPQNAATESLLLTDLVNFFRNPARFFLNRRLDIWLGIDADRLDDEPPAMLDGLSVFQLRSLLTQQRLRGESEQQLVELAANFATMPDTPTGRATSLELAREAVANGEELQRWPVEAKIQDLHVDIGPVRLCARLDGIGPAGRIVFRPATHKPKTVLAVWLEHLVLNCANPTTSRLLDRGGLHVMPPLEDAVAILSCLVNWYILGQNEPLPFFPATSHKFASQADPAQGRRAARQQFAPKDARYGAPNEGEDPYVRLAFRGRDWLTATFERIAHDVWDRPKQLGLK